MPSGKHKGRRADAILQALLTCRTIREAAAAARATERTMYEYLSDPAFKARYQAARDDVVRGAANALRERMSEAADVLAAIMNDTAAQHRDRRAAACAILDYGEKYVEVLDILERMQELEDKVNQR